MVRRAGLMVAWLAATLVSMFVATQAVSGVSGQVTDRPSPLPESTLDALAPPAAYDPAALPAPPTTAAADAPGQETPPPTGITATAAPVPSIPSASGTAAPADTTSSTSTVAAPPGPGLASDPDDASPTTSTTAAPTTTTTSPPPPTTAQPAPFVYAQFYLTGGFVEIRYRPHEVLLVAAAPHPGYEVSVKKSGPDGVEVEFEAVADDDEYEGELHAEWRDGMLDVEIDEHSEDS